MLTISLIMVTPCMRSMFLPLSAIGIKFTHVDHGELVTRARARGATSLLQLHQSCASTRHCRHQLRLGAESCGALGDQVWRSFALAPKMGWAVLLQRTRGHHRRSRNLIVS